MATRNRERRQKRRRKVRMKASFRNGLIVAIFVLAIGGYTGHSYYTNTQAVDQAGDVKTESSDIDDELPVLDGSASYTVFNVGDGEAILIKNKSTEALIDTGTGGSSDALVRDLQDKVDGRLEYLVLTGPSDGRLGGLSKICEAFDIDTCIAGDMGEQEKYVWSHISKASKVINGDNLSYDVGDAATLFVIRPDVSSDDPGDRSLVTYFTYGTTGFLSLSDAGKEEISRAFGSVSTLNALVLSRNGDPKINGAVPDNSYPYIAVSASKKSQAASGALDDVVRGNIYVTGVVGGLEFVSDGDKVYLTGEDEKRDVLKDIERKAKEKEEKS